MKFLKYFEAAKETPRDRLKEHADDIVKVLIKYYSTHTGDLCDQIDEIVWSSSVGDEFGETGQLTEEMVRQIIDECSWDREIEKLLDTYYDCREYVKNINEDDLESIKEIFAEYSDLGKINISKTSERNDNRYKIYLYSDDNIFLKVDFREVFGRMGDIGFVDYNVKANSGGYLEMEFWKPLYSDSDNNEDWL